MRQRMSGVQINKPIKDRKTQNRCRQSGNNPVIGQGWRQEQEIKSKEYKNKGRREGKTKLGENSTLCGCAERECVTKASAFDIIQLIIKRCVIKL